MKKTWVTIEYWDHQEQHLFLDRVRAFGFYNQAKVEFPDAKVGFIKDEFRGE